MPSDPKRRALLQSALALGAGLALPKARACEFFTTRFTLIHPWTRASLPNATSAIVCLSFQDVTRSDRLIGVSTPVAGRAEMGGPDVAPTLDFEIVAGRPTVFSETGPHLRLLDLKTPLLMAREYPLTLVFAGAGEVQARLSVDYARFL